MQRKDSSAIERIAGCNEIPRRVNRTLQARLEFARLARVFAAALLVIGVASCSSEDPTGPGDTNGAPPVLPAPERLSFDIEFFKDGARAQSGDVTEKDAGTQLNYFNARVRLAVIQVVAEFVLAPPVGAFALALHSVPTHQADGSYLWVYTFVDGEEEAQIRLRGTPRGDRVAWEMRVSTNEETPPIVDELWFEGETWRDGEAGFWRFHDFRRVGEPVVARIDWDETNEGARLVFTDLDENPGDTLSYIVKGTRGSIELFDASELLLSFIRWNEADGTGSLRAPDYNNGAEACWDRRQNDTVCSTAS
ncbi:MAG: hypothetical protein ACKVU1_15510 [bacterium]